MATWTHVLSHRVGSASANRACWRVKSRSLHVFCYYCFLNKMSTTSTRLMRSWDMADPRGGPQPLRSARRNGRVACPA
eukprot:2994004-Prymnesium_polylepis.1